MQNCWICDLGKIDYAESVKLQQRLSLLRSRDIIDDIVLLCEHDRVITCGTTTDPTNILWSEEELKAKGISVVKVKRGGDVTMHVPGQLVCYPILNVRYYRGVLSDYIGYLEQTALRSIKEFVPGADVWEKHPGIWIDEKQLAAIGLHISRSVTSHGIMVNVSSDVSLLEAINPCGMKGCHSTSIEIEAGKQVDMDHFKNSIANSFATIFDRQLVELSAEQLMEEIDV